MSSRASEGASTGLLRILSGIQDSIPYRLHADNLVQHYRRFLDPALFGTHIDHLCTLRATVTMLARRMLERGTGENDVDEIWKLNREVAERAGML